MIFRSKVMQGQVTKLCLVAVATLVVGCTGAGGTLCVRGRSWWNRQQGICIPCTVCDPNERQAVKVPCEVHRDTICQSIYELNIWSDRRENKNNVAQGGDFSTTQQIDNYYSDYDDYDDNERVVDNESASEVKWDLVQMLTLIVAASGCIIFFVVVLTLTLYHTRQWRKLKEALRSDVQDLSAKLKLMEAGTEPAAERIPQTDHHIYCNIHVGKDGLIGSGIGNVYTEE